MVRAGILRECSWQRHVVFRLHFVLVIGGLQELSTINNLEALVLKSPGRWKEDVVSYWMTQEGWSFSFELLACPYAGVNNGFSGTTWRLAAFNYT